MGSTVSMGSVLRGAQQGKRLLPVEVVVDGFGDVVLLLATEAGADRLLTCDALLDAGRD